MSPGLWVSGAPVAWEGALSYRMIASTADLSLSNVNDSRS